MERGFERHSFSVLRPVLLKNAYFSSAIRELSNGVWLVELYGNKNVDLSRSQCLEIVGGKRFERCHFSVLRPVLLKIEYFSSGN